MQGHRLTRNHRETYQTGEAFGGNLPILGVQVAGLTNCPRNPNREVSRSVEFSLGIGNLKTVELPIVRRLLLGFVRSGAGRAAVSRVPSC